MYSQKTIDDLLFFCVKSGGLEDLENIVTSYGNEYNEISTERTKICDYCHSTNKQIEFGDEFLKTNSPAVDIVSEITLYINKTYSQQLLKISEDSKNIKNGNGFDYVQQMSDLRSLIKKDIMHSPELHINLVNQLTTRFTFLSKQREANPWWQDGFIKLMQENKDIFRNHISLIDKNFASQIFNLSLKLENNTIIKNRLIQSIIIPIIEYLNKAHLISDQKMKEFKTNYAVSKIISR